MATLIGMAPQKWMHPLAARQVLAHNRPSAKTPPHQDNYNEDGALHANARLELASAARWPAALCRRHGDWLP